MKLYWTDRSRRDLAEIERYIARDDPAAARRWIQRLRARARKAAAAPRSGRMVPEIEHPEVREVLLRRYRIVYLVRPSGVTVLTVFESHRLMPPLT